MVHIAAEVQELPGKVQIRSLSSKRTDRPCLRLIYTVHLCKPCCSKNYVKQGEGGKIINFSSAVGLNGLVGCCDYAASRAV